MENIQELIPFVRELLGQKPNRGLLKVYLVGGAFAVLGTVISLVETVCQPFSSGEPLDDEMFFLLAREQEAETQQRVGGHSVGAHNVGGEEEEELHENVTQTQTTFSKPLRPSQRSLANRLHAS